MKDFLSILCIFFTVTQCVEYSAEAVKDAIHTIILTPEEVTDILEQNEQFAYFGPEICPFIKDFITIKEQLTDELPFFNQLCAIINDFKTTAPHNLIKHALDEIIEYVSTHETLITNLDIQEFFKTLKTYYQALESGLVDLIITNGNNDDTVTKAKRFKFVRTLIANTTKTNSLNVNNDTTINGALTVNGNQIINGDLIVLGELDTIAIPLFSESIEIQGNPQQACILFIDENNTEKARICSSSLVGDKGLFISVDNGTTQNYRITNEGGVVIAPPSSGSALSVTGNTGASAIVATGNSSITAPALVLIGNPTADPSDYFLTIDESGIVKQAPLSSTNLVINGCQTGPLTIGTSDATPFNISTNNCNTRISIDADGAVTINQPTSGEALTVTGNIVVPTANAAGTQGIIKLGGTNSTRINVYQFGARNFFAGSGTINSNVTGTDNIGIGTTANNSLTTANNTIAIGTASQATGTDSIAIGNSANTSSTRAIAIGSSDSSSTGSGPTASNINAIAIGSANGANSGASSSGLSAIAIGGADDNSARSGATASGDNSIAIGAHARSAFAQSIALGSSSGSTGGAGPLANNTNTIAIGSANNTKAGASASGISAIAIGGADGANFTGAIASGDYSIAVGLNTTASNSGAIAIGSGSSSATGIAATASNIGAIAIGSGSGTTAGASASGIASIAIGGANGTNPGASASGDRSVAIGNGATTNQADAIVLGSTSTGVKVGIGINSALAAKLDIVGVNGTPVFRMNQVSNAIGNAPVWLNPSTSATAGTPIHYDGSNRLFGFTSSIRYKTNIRSIDSESDIIYHLNPVIYDSKDGYGEGSNIPGLIAEEVYEIAPDLVILNQQGQPENISYNALHAFAIKELQKQQQQINTQNNIIAYQSSIIDSLLNTVEQLQKTIISIEASA